MRRLQETDTVPRTAEGVPSCADWVARGAITAQIVVQTSFAGGLRLKPFYITHLCAVIKEFEPRCGTGVALGNLMVTSRSLNVLQSQEIRPLSMDCTGLRTWADWLGTH